MRSKNIVVEITNKQLNALEDLLYTELTKTQTKKRIVEAKKLWQTLVSAYDESSTPKESFRKEIKKPSG